MNLISFTPADFDKAGNWTPKLTVSNDRLSFSKAVIKLTGLKAGDKILIHQDEDDPDVWYVSKENNGFALRENKGTIALYHSGLCNTILDAFKEKSVTFEFEQKPVLEDGKEFWKLKAI